MPHAVFAKNSQKSKLLLSRIRAVISMSQVGCVDIDVCRACIHAADMSSLRGLPFRPFAGADQFQNAHETGQARTPGPDGFLFSPIAAMPVIDPGYARLHVVRDISDYQPWNTHTRHYAGRCSKIMRPVLTWIPRAYVLQAFGIHRCDLHARASSQSKAST